MPQVIAGWIASSGIATGVTATVLGYGLYTAATYLVLRALAPKGTNAGRGLQTNLREAAAPQDYVYGQVRKGGTITYLESTGTDNEYLHMIIALAGHAVEEIGDIYINDEVVAINVSNLVTTPDWVAEDGTNVIRIEKYDGTQTATPANLLSESNNVDLNFVGTGIAYLYVRLQYDRDVFTSGIPTFTAVVKGKKVYDPRTATTAYSANAALCVRDYITSEYGVGDSNVDDTYFSSAANTCDEAVTLAAGGTEARYEINGVVRADETPKQILDKMMTACGGTLYWSGGNWRLRVAEYTAPVKSLSFDDVVSEVNVRTRLNRRDSFNKVQGTFVNAADDYITADYNEVSSATFLTEDDNVENVLDYPLPLTTTNSAAERLAKLLLFRTREQIQFEADFNMNAYDLEVGDVIQLTNARYGWTNKEFEVRSWRFFADQDAGDLRVRMVLKETSEAAFNWNAEETAIISNNSTLPSRTANLTVSGLSASGGGSTQGDGTFINSGIISWTAVSNPFVDHYEIQWKPTADSNYSSTTTTENSIEISPLIDGVEYTFRVRAVTTAGNSGGFTSVTLTGGGDTTVPSAPTSVVVEGGYGSAKVTWTAPTTNTDTSILKDLGSYKVFRGTSANPIVRVGRVSGEVFTDTGLDDNQTYYYRIKAVDLSGNESAYSTDGSGTTSVAPIGETGARGAGRWNVGVTTLPTTSADADSEFTLAIGDPVDDDQAWFYTGDEAAPLSQNVWIYDLGTDTWTEQTEAIDGSLVVSGTITGEKVETDTLNASHINTPDLAALNANLGSVTINKTLTMENDSSAFIGGKLSAGDLFTPGYFFGRNNKGSVAATAIEEGKTYEILTLGSSDFTINGADSNTVGEIFIANSTAGTGTGTLKEIGFELTVSSTSSSLNSAMTISDSRGINLINPTLWTGTPNDTGTLYSSSGTYNVGSVDSITVSAIGGGGGGGAGSLRDQSLNSYQAGSGGDTTVQIYDGDPSSGGTLKATLTATGGAGGLSAVHYKTDPGGAGDGDASSYGTGGASGEYNSYDGNSAISSHYGAGGGGGGYGSFQYLFGPFVYGYTGDGGAAGSVTTQTIDTSTYAGQVYVVVTVGTGGAGTSETVDDDGSDAELRSSGGNGASGVVSINSDFSGLSEVKFNEGYSLWTSDSSSTVSTFTTPQLEDNYEYKIQGQIGGDLDDNDYFFMYVSFDGSPDTFTHFYRVIMGPADGNNNIMTFDLELRDFRNPSMKIKSMDGLLFKEKTDLTSSTDDDYLGESGFSASWFSGTSKKIAKVKMVAQGSVTNIFWYNLYRKPVGY